jgi:hypothetical protein
MRLWRRVKPSTPPTCGPGLQSLGEYTTYQQSEINKAIRPVQEFLQMQEKLMRQDTEEFDTVPESAEETYARLRREDP